MNDRFSKQLSSAIKKDWMILTGEDNDSKMTYHKCRAIWFAVTMRLLDVDPFDYEDMGTALLGDGDGDTIRAYQRYNIIDVPRGCDYFDPEVGFKTKDSGGYKRRSLL